MIAALININFYIMKKSILKIGKALTKVEQKEVFGGTSIYLEHYRPWEECDETMCLNMPNPNYSPGVTPALIPGVCRDGQCYYE